jgi:hypothetical protein
MEGQGIQVTFLDQTGAKSVKAKIGPSVQVKKIIPTIITKMSLPATAPDGQPMSYSLDHKEGGKRLTEGQTLSEAQVSEGDHLIVYPEIVAGGDSEGGGAAKTRLTKADKIVSLVVAVLLACVCIRAALEAAASFIVPVVVLAVGYAGFRLWQAGVFAKLFKKDAETAGGEE